MQLCSGQWICYFLFLIETTIYRKFEVRISWYWWWFPWDWLAMVFLGSTPVPKSRNLRFFLELYNYLVYKELILLTVWVLDDVFWLQQLAELCVLKVNLGLWGKSGRQCEESRSRLADPEQLDWLDFLIHRCWMIEQLECLGVYFPKVLHLAPIFLPLLCSCYSMSPLSLLLLLAIMVHRPLHNPSNSSRVIWIVVYIFFSLTES